MTHPIEHDDDTPMPEMHAYTAAPATTRIPLAQLPGSPISDSVLEKRTHEAEVDAHITKVFRSLDRIGATARWAEEVDPATMAFVLSAVLRHVHRTDQPAF